MEEIPVILVTAGYDHTIRMWDALKSTCTRTIRTPTRSRGNPRVSLYDVFGTSEAPVLSLEGHTANVTAVEFTQDHKFLATSSEDKTIKWWDVYAGNCKRTMQNGSIVNDIAVHPDNRQELIISCDQSGAVRVWSWRREEILCQDVPQPDVAMRSVAVSPNGQLVVAGNNLGQVIVYRLIIESLPQTGRTVELVPYINFDAHDGYRITRVVFSSNGRLLATCSSDHSAKLWKFTERPIMVGNGVREEIIQAGAELVHSLNYHSRWVWDASWSSDSGYLVTVSTDMRAALWDVRTGTVIREFKGHQKGVVCVALNDAAT
ncbi:WD40-repeat-containing domain protein [Kickxella alabastrina]|uniref:WD40-repeat-containing domain protein n=1 Tax=Kickxella alabastrina TaxID=61397 RepID=UPI002220BAB9|nr:WD40-repeat-containing domain protein [Kickxella alabastrina]KAI7833854.1 WD40-repeat-containing domain protein [Kickxella alabastrina]